MKAQNYKIAWAWRTILAPGQTTDRDGYAPAEFSYVDGTTEVVDVKGPTCALSRGFTKIGEARYADVFVYEARDGSLRILAEGHKE